MKLRIALLLICLLALAAAPAFAQAPISLKVGVSFNKFAGKDINDTKNLTGFVGGIVLKAGGNDKVALMPEILFSMKGSKFTDGEDKLKVNYLDIPILVHFNVPTGGSVRPFVTVGPTVGLKLSASFDPEDPRSPKATDQFKKADVGFAAGVGVQASKMVSLEFRFQQSLSGILSDEGKRNFEQSDPVHNRSMMILLGIGH